MKTIMQRFMPKFTKHENGCWLWTAAICKRKWEYGRFGLPLGGWESAHRTSWKLFVGDIPEGMSVLHKCDVPRCVNPDHLFLGTQADNIADMDRKGRRVNHSLSGEDANLAKYTTRQVMQIRRLNKEIGLAQKDLAVLFFMSRSNVSKICLGKVWKRELLLEGVT